MRNSFLLAVSAYTAHFLATESYILSPVRPSPTARSSSTSIYELRNNCHHNLAGSLSAGRTLQRYCSTGDDQPIQTSESSWTQQVIKNIRRPLVGLFTAVAFFIVGVRGSVARPPKSLKTSGSPQKTAVRQNKNERQTTEAKRTAKKAEVIITVDKKSDSNSQLSRIGFVLVGVTTLATLLSGDDSKKAKKSPVKKQTKKTPSPPTSAISWEDGDEDSGSSSPDIDVVEDRKRSMPISISKKVRKGLGTRNSLPAAEDLFPDSEESNRFFEVTPEDSKIPDEETFEPLKPVKKISKFSLPPAKIAKKKIVEEEFEAPKISENVEIESFAVQASTPPPPTAKKSIFDRIFQKRSTSRPTDLGELLRVEDPATSFRTATATILTVCLPNGNDIFADVQAGGILSYSVEDDVLSGGEDKRVALLVTLKEELGLEPKEAADAFADVTNAMLVSLTDKCVNLLDKKGKVAEEQEVVTLAALDELTDFAIAAAGLFGQVLPGVIIEDGGIKYNGKAQSGKLETLFFTSLKSGMDMSDMAAMMAKEMDSSAEMPDPEIAALKAEKHEGRIRCLQHVFSISEGKKVSLEQKAMKDMIMGMMGGGGAGLGDLAGMLGNMGGMGGGPGGKGGMGMPGMDEDSFDQMMKQSKDSGMEDMDPAEMASVLNESLSMMRQQLNAGEVTKENLADLEASLGMGLKEMVSMIEMAKKVAGKKKIPEIDEMLALFKQLLAVKQK